MYIICDCEVLIKEIKNIDKKEEASYGRRERGIKSSVIGLVFERD